MSDATTMRVVPSGKIYKQMFEAQVQLNRSLTKIPRESTTMKSTRGGTLIPIVRLSKSDIEHGLLGDRQRTWAEGFPNDPYVENPVVYKQYAEFVGSQMKEPDASVEGREVRGLPDAVLPAKEGSNIIERIAASRKDRHESAIEEMHQELSVINSEMEPRITESCEMLIQKLHDDDTEISQALSRFANDEDLLSYPLEGLYDLWKEIQGHSEVRQDWIVQLDQTLKLAEDDRMEMIRRVFKDYAKMLEKIAHQLAPDLHRFMDKESQLINQTVLSNRRAYGDLFVRLMSMDIEREKAQHTVWKRRVDDWKMLKTELAIKKFKSFMLDEKVVSPSGVKKVHSYMVKEQQLLNAKRMELVNQLRDLEPPSSTKTSVYHWNKGVQDISTEIDTTNQLHLSSLHKEYEAVCQTCLDQIEAIKCELVETGVCTDSRAKTVVEQFMIPLVGDRQRVYEQNLETMEKALEDQNKTTTEQLKSLFKYAQGAAHVWDVHEIGLARQERALQEKLEQCRQTHDNQNQDKEAHLDIIMDRMRQDATEKALKDSLTKALEMLEKIRHAYEIFHKDQTNIVKQYPDMVKGELKNYDEALCKLFAVDRRNPLDTIDDEQVPDHSVLDTADAADDDGRTDPTKLLNLKTKDTDKTNATTMKGPVRFTLDDNTPLISDEAEQTKQPDDKDEPTKQAPAKSITQRKLSPLTEESPYFDEEIENETAIQNKVSEVVDVSKGNVTVIGSPESLDKASDNTKADLVKCSDPETVQKRETGGLLPTLEEDEDACGDLDQENIAREDGNVNETDDEKVQAEDANMMGVSETETDPDIGSDDVNLIKEDVEVSEVDNIAKENELVREKSHDTEESKAKGVVLDGLATEVDNEDGKSEEDATTVTDDNDAVDNATEMAGKKKPAVPKLTQKKEAKDLPSAVSEVLSTSKGTTFYVLTVAGEHGIPADKSTGGKGTNGTSDPSAFLTEVSGLSGEDSRPDFISSIDVPESALIEIKKIIRLNFLNHLEDWTEQASERSSSVVVAKCEELNSELDLRLHLHKPRARRAEYDVHNVRAAELVMHSERVTRHCKGIQQALTEVRNRFTNMTTEHNNLAAKFRQEIEALEVVFINATKASKLYGLKNQLNLELDKFMSIIRASLRQFRQHLDETLQMLRESNARFIKSFKVFSDGGNFCPEEIDEYRKRLDKMANNIDRAEGSVMSDLEDMESKRLEQATKVAMEFEDRFKSHMFDLIFMEKIARWLTNTQVKIKAEVANSNTLAQKLGQHLHDIERRIDACERPNLDKEQITSDELNDSLLGIFEEFHKRSLYLNCLRDPSMRPPSGTMQGAPAVGARVGFVQDSGPTPISKAGKQPTEDPSVGVIKTIMKSNKSKLRFGADAELDGEYAPNTELRDRMKSSMSTNTSSDRGKVNASRHGTSPGLVSTTEGNVRKAQSAATQENDIEDDGLSAVSSRTDGMRRTSKPAKYEKKTVIFGENTEEGEENTSHFLGIIRKSLKEALEGLLSASELYYRQKGSRPVTRPQALQETFDSCADVIVQKLQSYYQQADEYHNQCLQEFRSQLSQLEKSVAHIPSLVVSDLVKEHLDFAQSSRAENQAQFTYTQEDLEKTRSDHQQQLRPGLGHPHQDKQLAALRQKETDRHTEYVTAVEKHTKTLQENAGANATKYLECLARLSENQLLKFDNMLVVDEVEKGRVEAKKYPTAELIRRKNAGEPLEDDEDKNALPRGKNTWPGMPMGEMTGDDKPAKNQVSASVTTAKTTLGHNATTTARDHAYMEYKQQYEIALQQIAAEKERLMVAEQRWMDSWNTSVDKAQAS